MSDLLEPRTISATWRLGPFAEVRVGDHVTRYVRRGTGPCVLVLIADTEANPVWAPLLESLVAGHRVVIPQPPLDGIHSTVCLRGFIEGIGATEVIMIAGGSAIRPALEVAMADDFTVRRLILLPERASDVGEPTDRIAWVVPNQPTSTCLKQIEELIAA